MNVYNTMWELTQRDCIQSLFFSCLLGLCITRVAWKAIELRAAKDLSQYAEFRCCLLPAVTKFEFATVRNIPLRTKLPHVVRQRS